MTSGDNSFQNANSMPPELWYIINNTTVTQLGHRQIHLVVLCIKLSKQTRFWCNTYENIIKDHFTTQSISCSFISIYNLVTPNTWGNNGLLSWLPSSSRSRENTMISDKICGASKGCVCWLRCIQQFRNMITLNNWHPIILPQLQSKPSS